jgi:osmotically-inducible protein OsmY
MVSKPLSFYGHMPDTDPPANDEDIETKVANALARAGDVDAADVTVTEVDGEIMLQGFVLYPEEVAIAGDVAERTAGGARIRNGLKVRENRNPRSL